MNYIHLQNASVLYPTKFRLSETLTLTGAFLMKKICSTKKKKVNPKFLCSTFTSRISLCSENVIGRRAFKSEKCNCSHVPFIFTTAGNGSNFVPVERQSPLKTNLLSATKIFLFSIGLTPLED